MSKKCRTAERRPQLTILAADFSDWSTDLAINANIYLIILILGIAIGILLLAIGMTKRNSYKQFQQ